MIQHPPPLMWSFCLSLQYTKMQKRQIPDIYSWVQVYSIYMLVFSSQYPNWTSELISYQLFIVQHSKKFEYPLWLQHDTDSANGQLPTNIPNGSKYTHSSMPMHSLIVENQRSGAQACHLEGGNHTYDCPKFTFIQPCLQTSSLPYSPSPTHSPYPIKKPCIPPAKRSKPDHCIKGSCPYGTDCKFTHKCAHCWSGHPVTSCHNKLA